MGKRGPKPKTKALRVFEGDPGNLLASRHANEVEPPVAGIPSPPDWLGEVGKTVWITEAPKLAAIGLLTVLDYRAMAMYCEAVEEFEWAKADLDQHGRIGINKNGECRRPATFIKKDAAARIKQWGDQFGMSPVARVGLSVDGASAGDDLDEFKRGTG